MAAQFTIPLITVIPGQLIASSLWDNEWQNLNTNFIPAGMDSYSDTDAQMQIQTNPYPGSVTSHATSLGGEIERIRYQISQILGPTTPAYWYAAAPTNLQTLANISVPIGGSIRWPSATPPGANWLIRNGQAIGRVAYSALFALVGTTFGIGDGSTTFNIPNDTDVMPIGAGNLYALGATGGTTSQVIGTANLPASPLTVNIVDPGHNHSQNVHGHSDSGHAHVEQYAIGIGATAQLISHGTAASVSASFQADALSTPTQSGAANIQNTTATNNSNTTGITASTPNLGSGTALPTISPYLAEYWMMRVL